MNLLFQIMFIHCSMVLPFTYSLCLQIAYKKVRNLQIGVDKLVGKVSVSLLCHTKFISQAKSAACQRYAIKQIDLIISVLLLQLPYCVSMLLLTSVCKSVH